MRIPKLSPRLEHRGPRSNFSRLYSRWLIMLCCFVVGWVMVSPVHAQPLTLDNGATISGYFIEPLPYNGTLSAWSLTVSGGSTGTFTCASSNSSSNSCGSTFTSTVDNEPCETSAATPVPFNCATFGIFAPAASGPVWVNINWPAQNPPLESSTPSGPVKIQLITKDADPACLNHPAPNNYCSLLLNDNGGESFVLSVDSGSKFNAVITATESPGQIRYDFSSGGSSRCDPQKLQFSCLLPITPVVISFCADHPGVCGCTYSLCVSRFPTWTGQASGDPSIIFSGPVLATNPGDGMVTFGVNSVYSPVFLKDATIPELQIYTKSAPRLKVGEHWVVFAHGGVMGQSARLELVGLLDSSQAEALVGSQALTESILFQEELARRLNSAPLVVSGKVEAMGPIEGLPHKPPSPSLVAWRTATIRIQAVLKGEEKNQTVLVAVPSASQGDVAGWPYFSLGDEGIWLLREGTTSGGYAVGEFGDVLPIDQLPLARRLLAGK